LIFGQTYTTNPDLYYFWHSQQATNLGLNLSLYKDSKLDSLLELARSSSDNEEKTRLLLSIQDILNTNKPAIFLNNPYYINAHYKTLNVGDKNIYGSYSSFLSNMDTWFIHQKRALK
jgi:ABC-type transport system substrate-binding protein